MAKTLVLKGTNFSAHKIETVVFGDSVPCTGITLDQQTKAVTALSPFTLTATPAPSNTTDEVAWTSSDTDVATVANGVVTPVGLGEATITVSCGSYSATCAVTIDDVVPDFIVVAGYCPQKRTSSGNAATTDKRTGETSKMLIVANDQETGLYPIESKTDVDTSPYRFVPILIPNGATKIIINTEIGKFKTLTLFFDSTQQESTYGDGGAYCVYGTNGTWDQGSTAYGPIEITIPDNIQGLDSCCFAVAVGTDQTIYADITSQFSFKFTYDNQN